MTTQQETPNACPHCGAGRKTVYVQNLAFEQLDCGTGWINSHEDWERTELCREREARQNLKAEVERLREELEFERIKEKPLFSAREILPKMKERAEKAEAQVARLTQRLADAELLLAVGVEGFANTEYNLKRAIEIAETFAASVALYGGQLKKTEEYKTLELIKQTLN